MSAVVYSPQPAGLPILTPTLLLQVCSLLRHHDCLSRPALLQPWSAFGSIAF